MQREDKFRRPLGYAVALSIRRVNRYLHPDWGRRYNPQGYSCSPIVVPMCCVKDRNKVTFEGVSIVISNKIGRASCRERV